MVAQFRNCAARGPKEGEGGRVLVTVQIQGGHFSCILQYPKIS
jgi:hypothetical protein